MWEPGALGLAVGGAAFWLLYYDLKDRLQPEPRRMLAVAFLLGGVSGLVALGVYRVLTGLGVGELPVGDSMAVLRYTVLVVGLVEEGAKFVVIRLVVFRNPAFDEPIDGVIYAAAGAIGFATLENVLYAPHLPWSMQVARALASPLTHSLFAALWGIGLAKARFASRTTWAALAWQAGTLALAATAHGLYDWSLLAHRAPWIAAAVALSLWVAMLGIIRRMTGRHSG